MIKRTLPMYFLMLPELPLSNLLLPEKLSALKN